jgi:hypothetical protein
MLHGIEDVNVNRGCVDAHGAKVPFSAAHSLGTMVKRHGYPFSARLTCPDQIERNRVSTDMASKSSRPYPVWLSTVWVALSLALLCDGHPATAFLPLFFWFAHRRCEITDREESGVPSGGSAQPDRETAAAVVDVQANNLTAYLEIRRAPGIRTGKD